MFWTSKGASVWKHEVFTGVLVIGARQADCRTSQTACQFGFPQLAQPPRRYTANGSKKEGISSKLQLWGGKTPFRCLGSEVIMGRLVGVHRRATLHGGAVIHTVASQQKGCGLDFRPLCEMLACSPCVCCVLSRFSCFLPHYNNILVNESIFQSYAPSNGEQQENISQSPRSCPAFYTLTVVCHCYFSWL